MGCPLWLSTTVTVTWCSVRSLGLAVPSVTVTGTVTTRSCPSIVAFTVTVSLVVISGTPRSVTCVSLGPAVAV